MKILKIVFYVVVVLALVFGVVINIWGGQNPDGGSSMSLHLAKILMYIAAGAALLMAITNMVQHPKSSIKFLIGIGAILLITLIGYGISGGEVLDNWEQFGVTSSTTSKWIDAGWYLVYGILGISLVAIAVSEFAGLFNRK